MAKRVMLTADEAFVLSEGLGAMEVKSRNLWTAHEDTLDKLDARREEVTLKDGEGKDIQVRVFSGDCTFNFEKSELERCDACVEWYAQAGVRGKIIKPLKALGLKIQAAIQNYDKPAKKPAEKPSKKAKKKAKRKR